MVILHHYCLAFQSSITSIISIGEDINSYQIQYQQPILQYNSNSIWKLLDMFGSQIQLMSISSHRTKKTPWTLAFIGFHFIFRDLEIDLLKANKCITFQKKLHFVKKFAPEASECGEGSPCKEHPNRCKENLKNENFLFAQDWMKEVNRASPHSLSSAFSKSTPSFW